MSDSTKMLQTLIDGQRAIKEGLLEKVGKVDNKIDGVKREVINNGNRIDKLGMQLAELSDDAPTVEELDKLGKRVTNLEKTVSSN